MKTSKFLQKVGNKKIKLENIIEDISKKKTLVKEVLNGLSSETASIKFRCAKLLQVLSDKSPEILYPYWDAFVILLESENNILKWNAIIIIANLSKVDKKNKFEKIFKKYFSLIQDPVMITTANVVGNAYKIALAKPRLVNKITGELLKVEKGKWDTAECKNIILGKTVQSLEKYFEQIKEKNEVITFVKKRLKNTRPATKKKAEKFLKKHILS